MTKSAIYPDAYGVEVQRLHQAWKAQSMLRTAFMSFFSFPVRTKANTNALLVAMIANCRRLVRSKTNATAS